MGDEAEATRMFSLILIYFIIYSFVQWPVSQLDIILIPASKANEKDYLVKHYNERGRKSPRHNIFKRLDIISYEEATEAINIDNNEHNYDNFHSKAEHAHDLRSNDEDAHEELFNDYEDEDKIVGGFTVDISLYPYHIAYGSNCGGAIIGRKWAVTAGHCGKKPYVRVGSKYLNQGRKILVRNNFIHPNWAAASKDHPFDFDFQVLELDETLTYNENIQPVKVAHIKDMTIGKVITVTGWGNTVENGPFSDVLRAVRVPIVSKDNCQRVPFPYFRGQLTARMFCAGFAEGMKDACQGDSGGPAVSGDRLLGMVSFGYGCATPGSYGVYSKIAKVRSWIEDITGLQLD